MFQTHCHIIFVLSTIWLVLLPGEKGGPLPYVQVEEVEERQRQRDGCRSVPQRTIFRKSSKGGRWGTFNESFLMFAKFALWSSKKGRLELFRKFIYFDTVTRPKDREKPKDKDLCSGWERPHPALYLRKGSKARHKCPLFLIGTTQRTPAKA